jgi:hypothetical protein
VSKGESKVRAMVDGAASKADLFRLLGYTCCQLKLENVSQGFFGANSGSLSARAAPPNFSELHKFNLIA